MASVMNNLFIDKIDNIRAEFLLLEANLPCYSFLSMDYIMPICTTTLYHFDRVTDLELKKYIYFPLAYQCLIYMQLYPYYSTL